MAPVRKRTRNSHSQTKAIDLITSTSGCCSCNCKEALEDVSQELLELQRRMSKVFELTNLRRPHLDSGSSWTIPSNVKFAEKSSTCQLLSQKCFIPLWPGILCTAEPQLQCNPTRSHVLCGAQENLAPRNVFQPSVLPVRWWYLHFSGGEGGGIHKDNGWRGRFKIYSPQQHCSISVSYDW